jgi:hypothetical protein
MAGFAWFLFRCDVLYLCSRRILKQINEELYSFCGKAFALQHEDFVKADAPAAGTRRRAGPSRLDPPARPA